MHSPSNSIHLTCERCFLSAGFPTVSNTVLSLSNGQRLLWTGLDLFAPPSVLHWEARCWSWLVRSVSCDVLGCPAACHPFDKIKTSAHVHRTSPGSEVCFFVYRLGSVLLPYPSLHFLLTHLTHPGQETVYGWPHLHMLLAPLDVLCNSI